ncbi:MAG: hypothetical protein NBV68_17635 [Erythrobacter sp.]|uniref:hypothetical protein n=1 Tax=Erythrobacter sp. TaxID=1042 RepID=UPI0025F87254|nr:hypothetical protein [Erythrobacter sp.]MCM0001196.1 hypothetical protein [Erythrobacter sp.]
MSLDAIRIQEDEFTAVTLDLVGRSFGVSTPDDHDTIFTAEDLFEEVMYRRAGRETGDKCDSAMLFFRLRGNFQRLQPGASIMPGTRLKGLSRMSPKRLAKRLARETGLAMPDAEIGKLGCAMVLLGFAGGPILWWQVDFAAGCLTLFGAGMISLFDRGSYSGNWETVWSLVDAIARKNVPRTDAISGRSRPEDVWRRYAEILALSAMPEPNGARLVDAHRIGRMTRIELV